MKKEYRFLSLERYSKMSSSQENLKFGHLFSRRSFAGTEFSKERGARVELLFCLLRFWLSRFCLRRSFVRSLFFQKNAALFSLLVNVDLFVVCGLCY